MNNFYNANLLLVKQNLFGVYNIKTLLLYILSFRMKNFFMKNIYFIQQNYRIQLRKKYLYTVSNKFKNLYTISSFNGMCIYNYNDYKHGSYIEKNN